MCVCVCVCGLNKVNYKVNFKCFALCLENLHCCPEISTEVFLTTSTVVFTLFLMQKMKKPGFKALLMPNFAHVWLNANITFFT